MIKGAQSEITMLLDFAKRYFLLVDAFHESVDRGTEVDAIPFWRRWFLRHHCLPELFNGTK
jgi:hypothetical protein